jgi:ATP-binding cassette subfamily A (ABC1) protein 3
MAGAIVRQTWILTKKTLLVVFWRHWFFTSIRAFWAPIIFVCGSFQGTKQGSG